MTDPPPGREAGRIVGVGASAGGVTALQTLVHALPAHLAGAIVVVVHIPATARSRLPEILARTGHLAALRAREEGAQIAGDARPGPRRGTRPTTSRACHPRSSWSGTGRRLDAIARRIAISCWSRRRRPSGDHSWPTRPPRLAPPSGISGADSPRRPNSAGGTRRRQLSENAGAVHAPSASC